MVWLNRTSQGIRPPTASLTAVDISLYHRRSSFEALQAWISDARALASPDLVIVLVGNKLDDEDNREVEYLEAARWAKENGERI